MNGVEHGGIGHVAVEEHAQAVAAAKTLTAEPPSETFQLYGLLRRSLVLVRGSGMGIVRLCLRRPVQESGRAALGPADAEQQISQQAQHRQKEHGGRPAQSGTGIPLGQQGMYDAEPGKRMGKQQPDCLKIRKGLHTCFPGAHGAREGGGFSRAMRYC